MWCQLRYLWQRFLHFGLVRQEVNSPVQFAEERHFVAVDFGASSPNPSSKIVCCFEKLRPDFWGNPHYSTVSHRPSRRVRENGATTTQAGGSSVAFIRQCTQQPVCELSLPPSHCPATIVAGRNCSTRLRGGGAELLSLNMQAKLLAMGSEPLLRFNLCAGRDMRKGVPKEHREVPSPVSIHPQGSQNGHITATCYSRPATTGAGRK